MSRRTNRINRRNRVAALRDTLKEREEYIAHLERVSEAYTRLDELSREELIEADQIIRAQEIIQEMLREEKMDAVDTIHAHENVYQLMSQEKKLADMTIRAHEQVEQLAARENRDSIEMIKALSNLEELSNRERVDAYRFIEAQQQLSQLSALELVERDSALRAIMQCNIKISSLADEDTMLGHILDAMIETLRATHGAIFLADTTGPVLRLAKGIAADTLASPEYRGIRDSVQRATLEKKGIVHMTGRDAQAVLPANLSLIVVPLAVAGEIIGILYVGATAPGALFRPFDPDLATIFASQAAISINNARMWDRIRQQNDELLRLGTLKTQFIAHVSEELSDPVQVLQKSWAKLSEAHGMSEEEHAKLLRTLKGRVDRIDTTVSRILTLTALEDEAGELYGEKVNFRTLAEIVLERHQQQVDRLGLSVTMNFDSIFEGYMANASLIRTILDELLSNAVYYNKPNGTVEIRGRRAGEHLALDIIDTGRGIRESDRELIFQQFYRTEESSEIHEAGAGLGLFMARSFVERYKGTLTVKSVYGEGSTFTATFIAH